MCNNFGVFSLFNKVKFKNNNLLIPILVLGVFGILSYELGVVGLLPEIVTRFNIPVSQAGMLVSVFAFVVAISGLIMPLIFSTVNHKKAMLLVSGIFVIFAIISAFTSDFNILLVARIVPAIFHPIYCSLALTLAAESVSIEEAPKATSKVMMGVSAGMVLGGSIANLLASTFSLPWAYLFFALINGITFVATLIFIPSTEPKEKMSYGNQLSVLKKPMTWVSILGVMLITAGMYSVYSYFAEFIHVVTNVSGVTLTSLLLIFGLVSLVGNYIAGNQLVKRPFNFVIIFPFLLGFTYLLVLFAGNLFWPMFLIILIWGILFGIGGNIQQFWITSGLPDVPEFANGLFLSSSNVGVTVGTALGGVFISQLGMEYVVIAGFIFLILCFIVFLFRKNTFNN